MIHILHIHGQYVSHTLLYCAMPIMQKYGDMCCFGHSSWRRYSTSWWAWHVLCVCGWPRKQWTLPSRSFTSAMLHLKSSVQMLLQVSLVEELCACVWEKEVEERKKLNREREREREREGERERERERKNRHIIYTKVQHSIRPFNLFTNMHSSQLE